MSEPFRLSGGIDVADRVFFTVTRLCAGLDGPYGTQSRFYTIPELSEFTDAGLSDFVWNLVDRTRP